jgi:hypothetical protein
VSERRREFSLEVLGKCDMDVRREHQVLVAALLSGGQHACRQRAAALDLPAAKVEGG